ncbi:MAG: DUF2249 domain-containing protein [Bacteroidetes bacterium]|jgi:uncharacterized protein (DUF2249 family)|nr:DUF2249 domain-containing protein [Bacteroidota bacterium]
MIITPSTRIGAVIKDNPLAIDTLILLSPHFNKLKNPILRKLLAPRVTIAEAAIIGDCPVNKILDNLAQIGFEVGIWASAGEAPVGTSAADEAIDIVISHDARPQLAAGEDPLNTILKKLSGVKAGQTMLVINSFEPAPLIRLLRAKGYAITVTRKQPELVCTYITRVDGDEALNELQSATTEDVELFDSILQHYNLTFTEVDVREMEMPRPMITILEALEHLQKGEALYVRHKRIPVYLLPELKERNFNYVFRQMASEVVILIYQSYQNT